MKLRIGILVVVILAFLNGNGSYTARQLSPLEAIVSIVVGCVFIFGLMEIVKEDK